MVSDPFETLSVRAEALGVPLDSSRAALLARHFDLLRDANQRTNLTRVTDPEEAVKTLYLASFAVVPALGECGIVLEGIFRYLDLGTGAGFPGIPLAIAYPHLSALLVDARRKKIEFVADAISRLDLPRVRALHARGAELHRTEPGSASSFDLVTSRAVGTAEETIHEVRELVAPNGYVAIYKGPNLKPEEVRQGERAAARYGFVYLGLSEQAIEDLSPRILLFRRWSATDEGENAPD